MIKLWNTMTRTREVFEPIDPTNVRMYVCGPTVYDRIHLGNARTAVVFDTLVRLLRHTYGRKNVTHVSNITDVDDKIIQRAQKIDRTVTEITDAASRWLTCDLARLRVLMPNHEPRATQYIPQMIEMIAELIERGFAYEAEGHVYFSVEAYPDYGRLSGRSLDGLIAGARIEVAPHKRSPADFVMWKPSADDMPGWDSPWGRGRPGWHIECSAMSRHFLGNEFDIHGGGCDLTFPHHENEIAQSTCASHDGGSARFWLHNEMVQVESKKMSKSLGNFITVQDLLEFGMPGKALRFALLSTHYRKPMAWTEKKINDAHSTVFKWQDITRGEVASEPPAQAFLDALGNDLNTPGAIAVMHKQARDKDAVGLKASMKMIGIW